MFLHNFLLYMLPIYIYKLALINTRQCISNNSWSIHGLWPDYENGSYPQYCDYDRH